MAEWNSLTVGAGGTIQEIAEQASIAINTVQTTLEVVKTGADVAKTFISGVLSPQVLIISKISDELVKVLSDYKELGYYALVINPLDENYGAKRASDFGLEMKRDLNGYILFKASTVRNPDSDYDGQSFSVNEEYRKFVNIDNLSAEYRDRQGRTKNDPGFTPPIPRLVSPSNLILGGGYDPATWTGTIQESDDLPQLPAPECIRLMVQALDDEGDIPKYEIINKLETFSRGPYTESGGAVDNYDPLQLYKYPLFRSANTELSTSERDPITKQIKSGKPNYQGSDGADGLFSGVKISALAIVIAAPNPQDFLSSLEDIVKLLGNGIPDLSELATAFKDLFQPEPISITVDVNSQYGLLETGDIIKGFDSGAVGRVDTITSVETSKRLQTSYKFVKNKYGDIIQIQKETIDKNAESQVWKTTKIEYTPLGDPTNRFIPNEKVYEAVERLSTTADGTTVKKYDIKGMEYKGTLAAKNKFQGPNSSTALRLPKYGIAKGIDAIAPNSTPPDFFSIKAGELLPGWSDFFDGLIELAKGLKGFAEDATAFIEALIQSIDDLIEFFEDLADKIIQFLELFNITLPSAGIYALPITTTGGNKAIQDALNSSDNAPIASLKYSAGLLLMSTSVDGVDPLVTLGDVIGLEFQSV